MGLNSIHFEARDLPDAWFQAVDKCLEHGRVWTVEEGSYEGQQRWELDHVTIHIKFPGTRPLVPEMPPGMGEVPPPTTMEYVEEYMSYLMTAEVQPNESYTYGTRLAGRFKFHSDLKDKEELAGQIPMAIARQGMKPGWYKLVLASQIDTVIKRLKKNHGTNQCSMTIAQPSDIHLEDPPCLREIDCRIIAPDGLHDGESPALHFVIYFRSWDLWGGFPANLAGIRLMQEYMAGEIGVDAGEMIVASKGLHIYGHAFDLAKLRVGR